VAIDAEPDSTLSPASHPSKSMYKQISASRIINFTSRYFLSDLSQHLFDIRMFEKEIHKKRNENEC